MTILNDQSDIAAFVATVKQHRTFDLFDDKHSDPKFDAQRNLCGKTHFVDDETLRWHKSRVLSTRVLAEGLLFKLTTSDSLDWNNTKRGVRVHVFDCFGTHVVGPDLENAKATRAQAEKLFEATTLDVLAHYREALKSRINRLREEAASLEAIAATIPTLAIA